jgi:Na+/H+ antiporter NhaA
MAEQRPAASADSTPWTRVRDIPVRRFLRTETGSAAVLLAAATVAVLWANIGPGSYEKAWTTDLSIHVGSLGVAQDLRGWVNSGLMTFFFFVVGLEARREFDIGELRERRRVAIPVLAGVGGMLAAVSLYVAINSGRPSAHGWGIAMSTDTAFALALLAVVGPRSSERLRGFLLTVVIVDDVIALFVIAAVYSGNIEPRAIAAAVAFFALVLVALRFQVRYGLVYFVLGLGAWLALFESGVDPLVIGLAMGLLTYARPASRDELERATDLFRLFREQPTSELARDARIGLEAALSPNERLQEIYHPWTSYVIVPLFALANAGITVSTEALSRAATSPITLGVIVAYLIGKPVAITLTSKAVTMLSRGRLKPPVGWAAVAGAGTSAGIGFTVSLLIAALAFRGPELEEAKIGILSAALGAALLTWAVFSVTNLLPARRRAQEILGTTEPLVDLSDPVDPERDHTRGPQDAPVTLVEYGDFQCPYCGQAEPSVRALLKNMGGDIRYVWRHLPLTDVHPRAQMAAEASEAASRQDAFWQMHDIMLDHQDALRPKDLLRYAEQLGLDVETFGDDLRRHTGAIRIAEDVEQAAASGVVGTPTFFINGQRHHGRYDLDALTTAVHAAKTRAALAKR